MLEGELSCETVPPDIYFDCHKNKIVGIVVCALYDKVLLRSCFGREKNSKCINGCSVICEEYDCFNITSTALNDLEKCKLITVQLKKEIVTPKETNKRLERKN